MLLDGRFFDKWVQIEIIKSLGITFAVSVRLFAYIRAAAIGQFSVKFYTEDFNENIPRESRFG
jgi:hypothetical protein